MSKNEVVSKFSIKVKKPYSLELTALSHGWVNLLPYSWCSKTSELTRIEYIHPQNKSIRLSIKQKKPSEVNIIAISTTKLGNLELKTLKERLSRALSTNTDTNELLILAKRINLKVAKLVSSGGGRILRGTSIFEDIIKTLFTTNASWSFTKSMVKNLIDNYGVEGSFPNHILLKNISANEFRSKIRSGYRSNSLVEIVKIFSTEKQYEEKLPGLGKYGMAHVGILNNSFSVIPIDSEVRSFCRNKLNLRNDIEISDYFKKWGKFAFLGYKLYRQSIGINWIG
ncbi:hypothetical protein ACFLZT_00565 [Thermodesulfobacteriota bacterium]